MVGNEGEKSFVNLFAEYYGGTHLNASNTGVNIDTHLLSSIFSFLRSGYYDWGNGVLDYRAWDGLYWSFKAYSGPSAHHLGFYPTWLAYQNGYSKGAGFSVRCVARSPKRSAQESSEDSSAKLLILYVQKDGEW